MNNFNILYAVGSLFLLIAIFMFLPMFFTYLSSGDVRAPSEIHPTDSAIRAQMAKEQGPKTWGNASETYKQPIQYKTKP